MSKLQLHLYNYQTQKGPFLTKGQGSQHSARSLRDEPLRTYRRIMGIRRPQRSRGSAAAQLPAGAPALFLYKGAREAGFASFCFDRPGRHPGAAK
jgi:hypothetical protein